MDQFGLDLGTPPIAPAAARRLDITLGRVRALISGMSEEQFRKVDGQSWWLDLIEMFWLREMEADEEKMLGRPRPGGGLADAYDRLIEPGEDAVKALLKTFRSVYDRAALGQDGR